MTQEDNNLMRSKKMSEQKPSVGRIVHYVSYGTPGGEYLSVCRAAIITAVSDFGNVPGQDFVDLCVLNPEGLFFNKGVGRFEPEVRQPGTGGGTWHWPERV